MYSYNIITYRCADYNIIFKKYIKKIQKNIKKILTIHKKILYTINSNIDKKTTGYISTFCQIS